MYAYLLIVPILNYLDIKIDFIPYNYLAYAFSLSLYGITMLITVYLAIKHFVNTSKRRLRNGN